MEKETRQKELMRIMGLHNGTLWAAWLIDTLILMFISCVALTLMLWLGAIYQYSNPIIIFLYIFSFAFSAVGMIFFFSTFFSSSNLSAAVGGILFFMLYLPYNICSIWRYQMSRTGRVTTSKSCLKKIVDKNEMTGFSRSDQ